MLVAAILVLLVLVATAFITRTRSARVTAVAQQAAGVRSDSGRMIGQVMAEEIAISLFAHPLHTSQM